MQRRRSRPSLIVNRIVRFGLVTIWVGLFLAIPASPASADPAGPTNYESTILTVDPATSAATFEVTGGDAFLQVTVAPGHTVSIPGYFGEPYIQIDADGTVWVNEDSQALYINEDRYGGVAAPDDADGEGEPRWRMVADGGQYAWHDHRVHWMSRDVPPAVAGDTRQLVFPWRLPIIVDGTETLISGELEWIPSLSPMPSILFGIIALLPLTLPRRTRLQALGFLTGVGASIAAVTIVAQNNATPLAARGFPVWLVFPAIALAAAAWAVTRGRLRGFSPMHLLLVGAMALTGWALSTVEVFSMPILPSPIPAVVERAAVAFVLWAGVGIAASTILASLGKARHQRATV